MKTKEKPVEIVLATWPNRLLSNGTGLAEYLGDRDYGMQGQTCDSLWLSLRAVDDDSYGAYRQRESVRHTGLWVWLSATNDGERFCIEPRLHDVYSATLDETERMLRLLKRLCSKMPQQANGTPFIYHLSDVLKALGIRRAVEYRGIGVDEKHVPVAEAAPHIERLFRQRMDRCRANLRAAA